MWIDFSVFLEYAEAMNWYLYGQKKYILEGYWDAIFFKYQKNEDGKRVGKPIAGPFSCPVVNGKVNKVYLYKLKDMNDE